MFNFPSKFFNIASAVEVYGFSSILISLILNTWFGCNIPITIAFMVSSITGGILYAILNKD